MCDAIKVTGEWLLIWTDAQKTVTKTYKNVITNTGLNVIAGFFVGAIPQDSPMHLALGAGADEASSEDDTLIAEGYRRIVSTKRHQGGVIYLRFSLLSGHAIGEWSELGVFVGGTDMPDSGQLINRMTPLGGIRKTASQSLIVEVRIKLSSEQEVQ